jgi:excisionase family DNA binding protein
MSKYYNLEEAARALAISEDELKAMVNNHQIRAMRDGASMQFRAADVEEMARRRGLGSDPEFSLSDPELSLSNVDLESPVGGPDADLSEFHLGTAKPDFGQPSVDLPSFKGDDEKDVLLDDLSVPSATNSSSTILGMKSSGKLPSDSDVRLVPDNLKDASDSDVRLSPQTPRSPSDSDVTLVSDDQSETDFPAKGKSGDTAVRQSPLLGSSAEVAAGSTPESDSDFELTPSGVIGALQPESGSDFELSAVDASDEFDSTPMGGPGDSDVTAAAPADSGINLGRPSDSGINLGGIEGLNLAPPSSAEIQLAPIEDSNPQLINKPKAPAPAPAKPKPSLSATPPPSVRKGEKDIFEDTDFEVDALDSSEHEDRTMQLEATSDFDLDESDSASEVFAIDEEDVDENAATAMGPAQLDDESGEFGDDDGGIASSGWDVDSEPASPVVAGSASQGTVISNRGDSAEWGGLWVGFLGVSTILTLLLAFISIDLVRNLYDFRGAGYSSGIINALGGLFK